MTWSDLHLGVCTILIRLECINRCLNLPWMTGVPGYKWSLYVLEYRKPWWILNSKKKGVLDLVGNEELQQKFMIYHG